MHKKFTLVQSSKSFSKIKAETQSFKNKLMFLEAYTRAFASIETQTLSRTEVSLN